MGFVQIFNAKNRSTGIALFFIGLLLLIPGLFYGVKLLRVKYFGSEADLRII